jgi:septation ring formation regulator EzrA
MGNIKHNNTNGLSKIIKEEIEKVFEDYEQDMEAEISTALSFMQDIKGSMNKLKTQRELKTTTSEVDKNLEIASSNLNQAVQTYLSSLGSEVKAIVLSRIGEINIDK